ncbi:MAG: hypothetical protein WD830_08165 [Chloroflexota bacterium]
MDSDPGITSSDLPEIGTPEFDALSAADRTGRDPFEDAYTPFGEHYRLAYDLALKALDQQQETLDGLRERASTLLAAAAIVTSFLGGAALPSGQKAALGIPGWIAVVLFGLTVVTTLNIIRPRSGWRFLPNAKEVVGSYVRSEPTASIAQTHYGLAVEMEKAQIENRKQLNGMFDGLTWAVILIGLTIIAWIAELLA